MITKLQIEKFFESDYIAVAGVSRDDKKFSNIVFRELKSKGKTVLPVNPNMETFEGEKCFSSLDTLPVNTKSIVIVTGKKHTDQVFKEAVNRGFENIWIQNTSETDFILKKVDKTEANVICKECILMHLEPVGGIHKFHRGINKIFGKYPK